MGILGTVLGVVFILALCGLGFAVCSVFGLLGSVAEESGSCAESETETVSAESDSADGETNAESREETVTGETGYAWYRDIRILQTMGLSAVVWLVSGLLGRTAESPVILVTDAVLVSGLTVLTWIDLRRKLVPNKFLLVMLLIWGTLIGGCVIFRMAQGMEMLFRGIAGAVMSGGILFLTYLLTRKQVGGGDVKLSALMGLYLTGQRIIGAIFYGALLSSLFALIMLCLKKIKWNDGIPMVPFLYIGTLIVLLIS